MREVGRDNGGMDDIVSPPGPAPANPGDKRGVLYDEAADDDALRGGIWIWIGGLLGP